MSELIDTNIIFYSLDDRDPVKHTVAKKILKRAFIEGAVVSTQNLAEFFYQSKKKFSPENLETSRSLALAILGSELIEKVSYTENTMSKCIFKCKKEHDFWDLVIYYTMLENGITTIITENESDFEGLKGIKIINPFKL